MVFTSVHFAAKILKTKFTIFFRSNSSSILRTMSLNTIRKIGRGVAREKPTKKAVTRSKKNTDCKHVKAKAELADKADFHYFVDMEGIVALREKLLSWYDGNKRDLPWRRLATETDINKRAYSVWVSEIMLQQTQVSTVVDYYNKWMQKWPTLQDLAKASLEEVNEMWSGLGYYSRGRRLHEGAQKVVSELNGDMPDTAESLLKQLPGVGKYTAGAIASIAFKQPAGLVDGNVVRVFARMRLIGADSTSQSVVDALWSIAEIVVDKGRPGDFNQALMELGATVCTPKTPACSSCPVQSLCRANLQVKNEKNLASAKLLKDNNSADVSNIDIEECADQSCKLCLPSTETYDKSLGVMNYPRKGKKKPPREQVTSVCVVTRQTSGPETQYLILQRPETGLLANLWEFPSVPFTEDEKSNFSEILGEDISHIKQTCLGEVVHIFSHIHQTYRVETRCLDNECAIATDKCPRPTKWVTKEQFLDSAISTAMKKVFKLYETEYLNKSKVSNNKRKRSSSASGVNSKDGKKQLGMAAFFKPTAKPSKT